MSSIDLHLQKYTFQIYNVYHSNAIVKIATESTSRKLLINNYICYHYKIHIVKIIKK